MPRILVVDDERGPRESIRYVLKASCEVLTAATSEEALGILSGGGIDLVITDLARPGMDGLAFIREVQHRHPGLKVLVLSGSGLRHALLEAQRKEGAFPAVAACLQKPFDSDELRDLVRETLGPKKAD